MTDLLYLDFILQERNINTDAKPNDDCPLTDMMLSDRTTFHGCLYLSVLFSNCK